MKEPRETVLKRLSRSSYYCDGRNSGRGIIRIVLDEEEAKAWELSFFPHLFLPDMIEAHIASLNLQPVEMKRITLPVLT